MQPSALDTTIVSDCLSCPIGSVEASGGSLRLGKAWIRRTMVNGASVSAKSSGVRGSASPQKEIRGRGESQLTPETDSRSGMERHKPGPILASLESSQRAGLKAAASAP